LKLFHNLKHRQWLLSISFPIMQELNSAQNAAVGCACGTIEVLIDQPLLYWKNMAQQNLPFSLNPRLMYRGLVVSISNMAGLTALQFFSTGLIKRAIVGNEDRPLSSAETLASAFAGGAISGVFCGPFELTMIQQQRFGGTLFGTPAHIVKNTGMFGMTRGILPAVMREGIYTCGYLGITPLLAQAVAQNENLQSLPAPAVQFGCSMFAGFVATGLSHPPDTVKTCMQGDIEQGTYTRALSALRVIIATDGVGGLYKGFKWRFLRMGMTFFIFNMTMEPVSHALFPNAFRRGVSRADAGDEESLEVQLQ